MVIAALLVTNEHDRLRPRKRADAGNDRGGRRPRPDRRAARGNRRRCDRGSRACTASPGGAQPAPHARTRSPARAGAETGSDVRSWSCAVAVSAVEDAADTASHVGHRAHHAAGGDGRQRARAVRGAAGEQGDGAGDEVAQLGPRHDHVDVAVALVGLGQAKVVGHVFAGRLLRPPGPENDSSAPARR